MPHLCYTRINMHPNKSSSKSPFFKNKLVLILIAFITIVLGFSLIQFILANNPRNDLRSKLDAIALLSKQPSANEVCSEDEGGNENDFNYSRYAVWYKGVQDNEDVIKLITSQAKAAGYNLNYKQDNDPYVPEDFTIKKSDSGITQVPSREPNFTLKGSNKNTNLTLDVQAYRGTVNIKCDSKESFKEDVSYSTLVAPKGEIILSIGLISD